MERAEANFACLIGRLGRLAEKPRQAARRAHWAFDE